MVWGSSSPSLVRLSLPSCVPAEAAIRSIRQAQAEDLAHVDVDQLEKVLPQLVGGPSRGGSMPVLSCPPGAGPGRGGEGWAGAHEALSTPLPNSF